MKQCIKYKFIDGDKEYNMKPELTMGENLADIGGMSLSIQSLIKKLKNKNLDNNNFNMCLRLFFKSWANVWKQNISKKNVLCYLIWILMHQRILEVILYNILIIFMKFLI